MKYKYLKYIWNSPTKNQNTPIEFAAHGVVSDIIRVCLYTEETNIEN